jgi:hypothetical protein
VHGYRDKLAYNNDESTAAAVAEKSKARGRWRAMTGDGERRPDGNGTALGTENPDLDHDKNKSSVTAAQQIASAHPDLHSVFSSETARIHRARVPFPGEADKEATQTLAGNALLRQVQPGPRLRAAVFLDADRLPLPAVAHALLEVAMCREAVPRDRQALWAPIEKYMAHGGQGDA